MYKYLFGPVPSRRLGVSLGIDLSPKKVCSLNCVYCEVGKTTKLTSYRKEYILYDKVIEEIKQFMDEKPKVDFMTFSGSGEPTLNSRFGDVLSFIKTNYPKVKVAVLTNSTLLSDKNVRKELMLADVILPSLDAVTQKVFEKIDRPEKSIKIESYIDGIIKLSREFKGEIWLEVLFLKGFNDSATELALLKENILRINPTIIQLNTLDRPGVIDGLEPLSKEDLERIARKWDLPNIQIIASNQKKAEAKPKQKDIESSILETINRRPCTLDDLDSFLGIPVDDISKYLNTLEVAKKIKKVIQKRGAFYSIY